MNRGKCHRSSVLFGSAVLLVCLFLSVVFGGNYYRQVEASRTFRPVQATIVESGIRGVPGPRTAQTCVHVVYHYEVGGQRYESSSIAFFGRMFVGRSDMEAFVKNYPPGRVVEAYVNPQDPSVAVLDRTVHSPVLVVGLLSTFILLGASFLVYGIRWRPAEASVPDNHSDATAG